MYRKLELVNEHEIKKRQKKEKEKNLNIRGGEKKNLCPVEIINCQCHIIWNICVVLSSSLFLHFIQFVLYSLFYFLFFFGFLFIFHSVFFLYFLVVLLVLDCSLFCKPYPYANIGKCSSYAKTHRGTFITMLSMLDAWC